MTQQQHAIAQSDVLINHTITINVAEHRLQHGQCQSCGQQLYGFEVESGCCSALLFSSKKERELSKNPLTIPDLVYHGKCLKCEIMVNPLNHLEENTSIINATTSTELSQLKTQSKRETLLSNNNTKKKNNAKKKQHSFRKTPFERATVAGAAYVPHEESGVMIPVNSSSSSSSSSFNNSSSSSSSSSTLAIYHGDYNAKGERHGNGTITWANGDVYKGAFQQDQRHGHGILVFASTDCEKPDNGEYVGDWKDNQMHGEGSRRYPNGDVYVGHYREGKRQGHGQFYYANGDTYSGPWERNHMQGIGRYYYKSGQLFEGMFITSKRNGKGQLEKTDESIDHFLYVDDMRVGQGVRWNADQTHAWRLTLLSSSGGVQAEPISNAEATALLEELEKTCERHVEECMMALLLEY